MSTLASSSEPAIEYYSSSLREKYLLGETDVTATPTSSQDAANIGWEPKLADFEARSNARVLAGGLEEAVPEGWPKSVDGPLVWSGKDFVDEEKYVYRLSEADKLELGEALLGANELGLDLPAINRTTFPLPTLGNVLDNFCTTVHEGQGFVLIRGLTPSAYSRRDQVVLYLGISSYIAERRGRQNQDGMMLTHITDTDPSRVSQSKPRSVYSNLAQPFHTDVICDVLAMFCLSPAANGGKSLIAPSWTVYNELAATRPDLIHTLAQKDWVHDTSGRNPLYHRRALLHLSDNKPILNFSRRVLTGSAEAPRTPHIPPITEAQAEALDAVHFGALKHHLEIEFEAGDMCFINNLTIMHSRQSFKDGQDAKRYLLRLWLNNPERGWRIPEGLQLPWDRIFAPLHEIRNYWDVEPFGEDGKTRRLRVDQSTSCG